MISFVSAPARQASDRRFDAKGIKLHYLVEGAGEPVVLLHGLHSSALLSWQMPGVVNLLAKKFQVIALDLPGHGESDKPDDEGAYGMEMVEDVARLLDHLKIQKAHLVGYSMGGMIAVKFMAKYPDRVRSGVIGGMGWLREGSGLQKMWERMKAREDAGYAPAACAHSLGKLAMTEAEIKGIRAPVVVLVGDHDPVKGFYVTPLQPVRKDWQVIEIADAGHLNCIVKPQFKEEIADWLGKQIRR
jgi:pimeloyl-ACP methyl ester carboxylesterase